MTFGAASMKAGAVPARNSWRLGGAGFDGLREGPPTIGSTP